MDQTTIVLCNANGNDRGNCINETDEHCEAEAIRSNTEDVPEEGNPTRLNPEVIFFCSIN